MMAHLKYLFMVVDNKPRTLQVHQNDIGPDANIDASLL